MSQKRLEWSKCCSKEERPMVGEVLSNKKLEASNEAKQKIQRLSEETLLFIEHRHNGNAPAKYQLNYLNLRARAEPIRLLLHYVKQPFDERLESFEKFARRKDDFPYPRLPGLVVHGKVAICYTNVILQYLGRQYGLQPESSEQKATAEMLGQRLQEQFDFLRPFVNCLLGFVPRERLGDLREDVLRCCARQQFGPLFEAQLERNKSGYLVGDSLTWIDFYAAAFTDQLECFGGDVQLLEPFPRIRSHKKALFALSQLEDYLRKRPKTLF